MDHRRRFAYRWGVIDDLVAVNSSNLSGIGYDGWSAVLVIEFHGGRIYQYADVPYSTYEGLMRAESHGKYFAENIRNHFSYRRLR